MIRNRLKELRQFLVDNKAHAIMIPSEDPHQSEYPADHWKIREWISGFTGSAGLVIIGLDKAGLWTDSRYFIQAENELKDSTIELHKVHNRSKPGYLDWIQESLKEGEKLTVIDEIVPYQQFKKMQKRFENDGIIVESIKDPFIKIWHDRPPLPKDKLFSHPDQYAGESRKKKIDQIKEKMKTLAVDHCLITALDEIAWSLNLRSTDVECNPVFISYFLVSPDKCHLFVDKDKLTPSLHSSLEQDDVHVHDYYAVYEAMHGLDDNDTILVDKALTNRALYSSISKANIIGGESPVLHLKAIKTKHELDNIDQCMIQDGIALTHAFYWLEKTLKSRNISEYEFAMKIAECRSNQTGYYGESFNAIVGYKSNGAIVHYRPLKDNSKTIESDGILLVDCGGQYMNGTTDITRTIALDDKCTHEQKKNYTLVLKGHIALAEAQFPESTTGCQLDILARQFLWQNGLSYAHGTGHGVGYFNNVHEGPQGIAPSPASRAKVPFKEGMLTSNEPGFYKEGEYGIRIENLIVCEKSKYAGFLKFRTVSLFPIDTSLIDNILLNDREKSWLNAYHIQVFKSLSPFLDNEHKNWLSYKCAKI